MHLPLSRMFPQQTPSSHPSKKHWTYPCTETEGYSAWHLLALGLYSSQAAGYFLTSTLDERPTVVFDHLFEHITQPIDQCWFDWADIQLPHQEARGAMVGMGIEELCRCQGLSLLGHYHHLGIMRVRMNPAVFCFEQWIQRELGY